MALAHQLFAQLRIEIFDSESLSAFAERLGFDKSHVWRMESGRSRILPEHVALFRKLRVPSERKPAFSALLDQLADVVAQDALSRIDAKKERARQARHLARLPPPLPAPDPAWLQSWDDAVRWLADAEAQAEWLEAVDSLRAQAVWDATVELLLASQLAQLHLHEAWEADWKAAVELLQAESDAALARTVLLAAALVTQSLQRRRRLTRAAVVSLLLFVCAAPIVFVTRKGADSADAGVSQRNDEPAGGAYVSPEEIGEKDRRARQPIPPGPFKSQKRGPCDESEGEVLISGGCWYGPRDSGGKPCGKTEYESTDGKCYRPVRDPRFPTTEREGDGGAGYGGEAR